MGEPKTTLAEQLKKFRLAKGHATARGFAAALGISENRYSRYERGEAVPKLDLVWAICIELGITPNELYGWDVQCAPQHIGNRGMSHAAPGLAEDDAHDDLSPSQVEGRAHREGGGRAASSSAVDLAAWQLAAALVGAARGDVNPGAGGGPRAAPADSNLRAMRATADLFLQLKRSPLEALARLLQKLSLEPRPPETEARIAGEVRAFLAALGANRQPTGDFVS